MPEPCSFGHRSRHISRALIRQCLEDSDNEDSGELETTGVTLLGLDKTALRCAPTGDLLSCKSWLDRLCDEEQDRFNEDVDNESGKPFKPRNVDTLEASGLQECRDSGVAVYPAMDTRILNRIRQGRGPRDEVPEDLLAVFRDGSLPKQGGETYEEMKQVLLAWNQRVSPRVEDNEDARAMLGYAVEKRGELLRSGSQTVGAGQALEELSDELLQALIALRPEIADFQNQKRDDILMMIWANVRVAVPDLDDEVRLLTMKALIDEFESKAHMHNAEKLSGMARALSVARLEHDVAEIRRQEIKIYSFKKKLSSDIVKKVIDRIKTGRRELTQMRLKELQELTELQAAQKWAAHAKLEDIQSLQEQTAACDQAGDKLRQLFRQQVPELDAHVQVVQNNANGLAKMSSSLLSRAKQAGVSLDDRDSILLREPVEADVQAHVTGTVADILEAQKEAARMLDRMDTIESHLDVLLDAAKSHYRACDGALHALEEAETLGVVNDDKDVEFAAKYGPRRESIMLMARNMQKHRDS